MKTITRIHYNWLQVSDGETTGEDFDQYEVGKKGVSNIEEHRAAGEGDKWYYDIIFDDGRKERIFNPNRVFYSVEDSTSF